MRIHYGGTHEYIKRSDVGCFLFLSCGLSNYMGDVMKKIILSVAVLAALTGCSDDARVASQNLSKAADNFEINRRVVFYNGITSDYLLSIEGLCSIEPLLNPTRVAVICKVAPKEFKKHFLGLSDNVTYFVEQLDPNKVSVHHYRVTFKPSTIIPDIRVQ